MLGDNRAAALFNHVKALEKLQEVVDDARGDYNERKALCKEDGFDTNVVAAILKRRKNGEGQTQAFDELLREYEDAIAEQKAMPLTGGQRGLDADIGSESAAAMRGQRIDLGPDDRQLEPTPVDENELYPRAKELVISHANASTSWLQRQLQIGHNSAARLIERMEAEMVVSRPDSTGKRAVAVQPEPAAEPLFDDAPAVDRFENEGGKADVGETEKDPF